jgi:surface antigen
VMGWMAFRSVLVLLASASVVAASPVAAAALQCVPFARSLSGIAIYGNAKTWWGQAAGVYTRGQRPRAGAVLAFAGSRAMPLGHVAVVSRVLNAREVLLDHANWSYRGGIERGVLAVDVSSAGDWSAVRVWHSPTRSLGLRVNPAYGFIYPANGIPEARLEGSPEGTFSPPRIDPAPVAGIPGDRDDRVTFRGRRF